MGIGVIIKASHQPLVVLNNGGVALWGPKPAKIVSNNLLTGFYGWGVTWLEAGCYMILEVHMGLRHMWCPDMHAYPT
jgi:hypothetical protein